MDPALLPRLTIWPGIDCFHQWPGRYVSRVTNDRRAANLPIARWKWWRIKWRRGDSSGRRRGAWCRRLISRCSQILAESVQKSLAKPFVLPIRAEGCTEQKNCANEQPTNAQRASVMNFQFLLSTQTRRASRDEAPHFSRSRISRHALHFNDAYEVSCRAGAIKCSRCRASFAPIRAASRAEFGSPVGPATRRFIKRNKELAKSSD